MPENALDVVLITRPLCIAVRDLLLLQSTRIEEWLEALGYVNEHGKPLKIAEIVYGKRPENRAVQRFPAISVVPTTRNPTWYAYRTTNDTIPLRIFCCVENTADAPETCEALMNDFTEIVTALLFQNPTFPFWYMEQVNGELVEAEARPVTSLPGSITFGTLDKGFIRAGQIDLSVEVLLCHQNMNL